jgi:HEAT repeat protein
MAANGLMLLLDDKANVPPDVILSLINALGDESDEVYDRVYIVLKNISNQAAPSLARALKDSNPQIRIGAARVLSASRAEAELAVPILIQALNTNNPSMASRAEEALTDFGPEAKAAVPSLIEMLRREPPDWWTDFEKKETQRKLECHAALPLGAIGPDARAAIPYLIKIAAAEETNEVGSYYAVNALGMIGPEAADSVPVLIGILKRNDPVLGNPKYHSVATALGQMGAKAKPALHILSWGTAVQPREDSFSVALANIAKSLQDAHDTTAIPDLDEALEVLETNNAQPSAIRSVRDPLVFLKGELAAGRGPPASADEIARCWNLVVQLSGESDGKPVTGSGIIFAVANDRLYIVTAKHVVRKGGQITGLKANVKSLPGESLDAELADQSSTELDVAVVVVRDVQKYKIPVETIPFDRLGKPQSLRAKEKVYALGLPNERKDETLQADEFGEADVSRVKFSSKTVRSGYSGGALFNSNWQLVGMIRADDQSSAYALPIDQVLAQLKEWGYPISLKMPPP